MSDQIVLRPFQQLFWQAVEGLSPSRQVIVADVHPGSGKTLAALHAANMLWRQGIIDRVAVYVPRLNLCQQFEKDWAGAQSLYQSPVMPAVVHRTNEAPLFRRPAVGVVSTYASLAASPQMHLDLVQGGKTLLILDEAQQLGVGPDGTLSAKYAQQLASAARMTFVLSGTPYRADNKPLLLAQYRQGQGRQLLCADVVASYERGVAEGYLRPCVATLASGKAIYAYFDGLTKEVSTDTLQKGLQHILQSEGFWADMVDTAVDRVRNLQTVHPQFCGLIAACSQDHARAIKQYLARRHPTIRSLIAVSSDDQVAHESLRAFRRGGYDILISVRMAYVGYDHKPIAVVLVLSDFRDEGFLRQLVARGMRMWDAVAPDQQHLHIIAPDDPKMRIFLHTLEHESTRGLKSQLKHPKPGSGQAGDRVVVGQVEQSEVTDWREHRVQLQPPAGTAQMTFDLHGDMGHHVVLAAPSTESVEQADDSATQRERENDLRKQIARFARQCDERTKKQDALWQHGYTMAKYNRTVGGRTTATENMEQLAKRLMYVQRQLKK